MPARKGIKPTHAANVLARERDLEAMELRKAGATYRQIGERQGTSLQAAYMRVKGVIAELTKLTAEEAVEVRKLELERLDVMLLGLWPKARAGDERAVSVVLKIQERRSALLGLDAPKRQELTGAGGAPIEIADARKEIEAVVARLSAAIEAEGNPGEPER